LLVSIHLTKRAAVFRCVVHLPGDHERRAAGAIGLLRAVWLEWFSPGGTRPRYDRSADGIEAAKVHVTVSRSTSRCCCAT
jgi:hypothetical protein